MNTYRITIGNGSQTDAFSFKAQSAEDARLTATAAHTGTGWQVIDVRERKKKKHY